MHISLNDLLDYDIEATDGDMGFIKDVLFDDKQWTVRYLTVDTKRWMPLSKKVLISPIALQMLDSTSQKVHLSLSKQDILDSPSIDAHKPVSREFEEVFFDFFGYGYYWNGLGLWGDFQNPTSLAEQASLQGKAEDELTEVEDKEQSDEPHLRSIDELKHYDVVETDGMQGHVHDFILDTDDWTLQYLVIDTRNWLPGGRKVLLPPQYLESLSWKDQAVFCRLKVQDIKSVPEYESDLINDTNYLESVKQAYRSRG